MASKEAIRTAVRRHCEAVGAADAAAVAALYAPAAHLHDPAGADAVVGRDAIRTQFASVLTEQRQVEIILLAVTADHAAAVLFRATPADGPAREVIDTMTFDEDGMITSMHAYAG
jgi:steroid delta-isomerase